MVSKYPLVFRMNATHRQKLVFAHLLALAVLSVLFWSLFHTILWSSENGGMIRILIVVSMFFPWLLVGFLLWKESWALLLGSVFSVLPVFFWTLDIRVYLGLFVASLCIFLGAKKAQHEIRERLTFLPSRAFFLAKQSSVLGFSIALSFGYFLSIQTMSWDNLVSRFHFGEGTVKQLISWAGYIQPELASIGKDHQTVDEYILSLNHSEFSDTQDTTQQFHQLDDQIGHLREQGINIEFSGDALASVRGAAKENMLLSGRKQLEGLVGRSVKGDELITTIFAEVLQKKLFAITEGAQVREHIPDRSLPIFIAILFFLTIWPLALLLFSLWNPLAALLINLFRRFHWIEILRHTTVQERLEE